MQWDDIGYLVSKNRYNENSIIAEFFTKDHGKFSGIIFGATSKKLKNYLQIGNNLHINYNYKNEDQLGYFKIEILEANTPLYFDNKKKLLCINSAMNLIKLLTAEAQSNIKVFDLINDFFNFLNKEKWIVDYIFWELSLLKYIGFDLNLKKIIKSEIIDLKTFYYVESISDKKYVPNFLIDYNRETVDYKDLLKAFKIIGDYMEQNILLPNNLNHSISRLEFINLFK